MKTIDDKQIKEILEEAVEDLQDAEDLARRRGGFNIVLYHCCQAAEKFLVAVAVAAGRQTNPMWDLQRIFEVISDIDGLEPIGEQVQLLAAYRRAPKTPLSAAFKAVHKIRRSVLLALGADLSDEPAEEEQPAESADLAGTLGAASQDEAVKLEDEEGKTLQDAPEETAQQGQEAMPVAPSPKHEDEEPITVIADAPEQEEEFPGVLPDEAWGAEHGSMSREARRDSYVKVFLVCQRCGVRIPRTRQTARGRTPCPHCGRPMVPVR